MNKAEPEISATEQQKPLLEVIVCSVNDAIAAEAGGADRLEIISHFEVGGLTPPLNLVQGIIAAVHIPVRVMLRESEDFNVTDENEKLRLCNLACELAKLPVDGFVCGFLKDDAIDDELLRRILESAPNLQATFHRAFEQLSNPVSAIHELKKHPQVDRILTIGIGPGRKEQIDCLVRCAAAAQPEITILAGGGIELDFIRQLRARTVIREFHVGRIAREPETIDGAVSSEKVRQVRNELLQP